MLTQSENQALTRVGPETPMGQLHRRYWVAALLVEELPRPGGPPKPLRLLGEDLVAFRSTDGQVGILDRSCPHRGADLSLARNEACGLRCIYHGWMIDTSGNVLETPNEPEKSRLKANVKQVSYPVREAGGLIWVWMGPREEVGAFPQFEWLDLPSSQVVIEKLVVHANWLQNLEGSLDSSHSNFLHADIIRPDPNIKGEGSGETEYIDTRLRYRPTADGRPRLEIADESYGFRYAALRRPIEDADALVYARVTVYALPAYVLIPQPTGQGLMPFYVPVDDENTVVYVVRFSFNKDLDEAAIRDLDGVVKGVDVDENYRFLRNKENHWNQDRLAMDEGRQYCGVSGIASQDAVVVESLGPIYDRSKEHVGSADLAVVHLRRRLLQSLDALGASGERMGVRVTSEDYRQLRAWQRVIPIMSQWKELAELPV